LQSVFGVAKEAPAASGHEKKHDCCEDLSPDAADVKADPGRDEVEVK